MLDTKINIIRFIKFCSCFNILVVKIFSFNYYILSRTNITIFFRQGGSKKKDLSDLLNNSDEFKKPREDSLEDSLVLKCSALGYVFAGSLKAPDCVEILLNMKNENQLKKVLGLIKSTETIRIKG